MGLSQSRAFQNGTAEYMRLAKFNSAISFRGWMTSNPGHVFPEGSLWFFLYASHRLYKRFSSFFCKRWSIDSCCKTCLWGSYFMLIFFPYLSCVRHGSNLEQK